MNEILSNKERNKEKINKNSIHRTVIIKKKNYKKNTHKCGEKVIKKEK